MFQIRESENKELATARLESLYQAVAGHRLITMVVEPSSHCNLTCTFCAMHSTMRSIPERFKGEMSTETFCILVDQLAEGSIHLREMQFHGFGEPLLNKRLPEFLRYARDNNIADRLRVTTNGTLLTPARLQSLAENGVTDIHISVDAADAERFRELKGKDLFPTLDTNIWNAVNYVNEHDQLTLLIKCSMPRPDNLYGFTEADMKGVIERYRGAFEHSENIHVRAMTVQAIAGLGTAPRAGSDAPCEFPFYSLYLRYDGTITVCCADFAARHSLGNIHRQSVVEILRSEALRTFRLHHVNGALKDLPMCYYCDGRSATDITPIAPKLRSLLIPPQGASTPANEHS